MNRPNTTSPKFRKMRLHNVEIERKQKIKNLMGSLKNNEQTYLLFSFKTDERQENNYVKDYERQLLNSHPLGIMNTADLWSNKQINRYMDIQSFTKDKFLLSQLSRQKILYKIEKLDIPVKFYNEKVTANKMSLKQIINSANLEHQDNMRLKYQIRQGSTRIHSEHF